MIRRCRADEEGAIHAIINDAAEAYRGVIPPDRWHEPYMSREELHHEIEEGIVFWGFEERGKLIGVMGLQDKGKVALIRHAYVRSDRRNEGIGSQLLSHLESLTDKPILVGTWADATWAIKFYEKNGYRLVPEELKDRLLKKYWSIPERQIDTSVVLANAAWFSEYRS
ncbi:MAG: GNAT family N-acetyltransferase [Chloroflexota bacterium]|nr:GNAT family N-acetyltransferase [Chloroflexota bacterium]